MSMELDPLPTVPSDDTQNDDASSGGIYCSAEYSDDLTELSKLFEHKAKLAEAARFAMTIGIQTNSRIRRETWSEAGRRNIANLAPFQDPFDFKLLFTELGLIDGETPLNILISEYIEGGMKWIRDHEINTGTHFSELKEAFSDLFTEP